jgi:lipid II:glycine glycyltransferase (peptidoglycan interpeptide bridge formation enzyme)
LQIEPLDRALPFTTQSPVYKKFLTPHTQEISLLQSNEDILSQMHEKGRYNIRLAEKRGVRVGHVSFSEENLEIWLNLLRETTSRDGFSGNSDEYYRQFLTQLGDNHGGLYFAYYGEHVIAA